MKEGKVRSLMMTMMMIVYSLCSIFFIGLEIDEPNEWRMV